jgi:acetyltransferase-like isoleucine patch superfamily enzyme
MANAASLLRSWLKTLANLVSLVLVLLPAANCWLEKRLSARAEGVFGFWTNVFALLPGLPGMYLRRAFYHLTLEYCSLRSYIGFGTLFSHRSTRVEDGAYIGPYSLIGSAWIKKRCLLGSRVSLLSGPLLHELDKDGHWTPADLSKARQIVLEEDVWIGEGASVMVNVGRASLVGTGAVVSTRVRAGVVVAGNPARFVRRLRPDEEPAASSHRDAEASIAPTGDGARRD